MFKERGIDDSLKIVQGLITQVTTHTALTSTSSVICESKPLMKVSESEIHPEVTGQGLMKVAWPQNLIAKAIMDDLVIRSFDAFKTGLKAVADECFRLTISLTLILTVTSPSP
jgi:hypothetical protein